MRFLLFNIVVAGALVFLFTSDKADLHAAADRAHDAANDIKSRAFEVIQASEATTQPAAVEPAAPANPTEKAAGTVEPRRTAAATATTETPISQNKPLAPAAAKAVREVQVATRKLVEPLRSEPIPADVAQRREEVMAEGIVGSPVTGGENFMPASTRKRDLMLLSEEMELFSAKAISR